MRKIVVFRNDYNLPMEVKRSLYSRIKGGYHVYSPLLDVNNNKIAAYMEVTPKNNMDLLKIKSRGGFETYHYFGDIVFAKDVDNSKMIKNNIPFARDLKDFVCVIENYYKKNDPNVRIVSIPDHIDWEICSAYTSDGDLYEYVSEKHKDWIPDWDEEYDDFSDDSDDDDYNDITTPNRKIKDNVNDYKISSISSIKDHPTIPEHYFDKDIQQDTGFVNKSVINDILLRFKHYMCGTHVASA